ncbi:MAG: TFIIB-type zinc ribbon-containing protein [Candidatus Aenigmarchaeota archaeon]|nr:transcription initiation factor IIB [Candidatus Aenigmarchaeota archaeon]MDW8149031.1 TFIIB-type zinc ribbon-containing protein [Candidatus Aenigmarchaeota archaeon]
MVEKTKVCKECGSTTFIEDQKMGEIVCAKCGLVLEEGLIDLGQEWRAFDAEQLDRRARGGSPITVVKHDKGISAEIGKGLAELYKVPSKKRAQYYRITKWHKKLLRSKERNLSFAMNELQRLVSFLQLPKTVHEMVASYYEKIVSEGLIRGRSVEAIVAALVFAVSKQLGNPRSLEEIVEASGVERKDLSKAYRQVCRTLGIRILPTDPINYIPRYCSELNLSDKVTVKAIEILKKAKGQELTRGKGPGGIAGAAIYIASLLLGEKRSQREIANICGITDVTLRNRAYEIARKIGIEKELSEAEKKAGNI